MKNTVKDLIEISQYAGSRADYTQGGGGNTSVKNYDEGVMLIKASGYRLKDITQDTAYVGVNLKMISDYYNNVDISVEKDYEKESAQISSQAVIDLPGIKTLRPSVEVGFHSILKKYVIHTHSVFANVLTCCMEGEEVAKQLFEGKDYGFIFLPYINPGFELTLAMKRGIEEYVDKTGKYPEVIFMKNHGLVVNADSVERAVYLHTDVNDSIKEKYGMQSFSQINLIQEGESFVSKTPVVAQFMSNAKLDLDYLNKYPLYPDQLVYLNNILAHSPQTLKIEGDKITYNTDIKQATTLEETLAAYLFVILNVKKAGLTLSVMNEKEVYFINHWEAEKYRRSVK